MESMAQKIAFVKLISEKKNVLFGAFSATLTKLDKAAAWKWVISQCRERHGFDPTPQGKDWTYVRDTVWATNTKNRTIVS